MNRSATVEMAESDIRVGEGGGTADQPMSRSAPIQQVAAALYRQRLPIIGAILIALILGAIITLFTPRQYTASSSVRLEQQAPQVINAPELDPQRNAQDSERFLQTQIDLVHSRSIAEGVELALKASKTPATMAALDVDEKSGYEGVIRALQDDVVVERGLNTRLAVISFSSRDAAISARIANAYAEQLVNANLNSKADTSTRAATYLNGQLAEAKTKLEDSERRLLGFARSADLSGAASPDVGRNGELGSLRAQQLGVLTSAQAESTARRIAAEEQWRQIAGTSAMALPQVQANGAVQDLQAQRAKAAATMAGQAERYTIEYPSENSTEVAKLDTEIQTIAGSIKRSYYDNYRSAVRQEAGLRQTIDLLRGDVMAERMRGIEYGSLEREVQTSKAFYDGLLQRYKEIVAASGAPSVNVTIVDKAYAPAKAISPNITRNMALALILGLIAAMAIALVRERMNDVIRSAYDLGSMGQIPFIGSIPLTERDKRIEEALEDPRSPQSEAYNSVAISLKRLTSGHMPRSLLVTSSKIGEGKSTSALNIARGLARMRNKVLLIDGDLRRPSIGTMLGLADGPGFAEALAGKAPVAKTVRMVEKLGLDVITAGKDRDQSVSLLAGNGVGQLLAELSDSYDIVIIDGPPIIGLADAVMLADHVEAVVMVVEANRIHSSQFGQAMSRLPARQNVGGVITKFDAKSAGVGYGNEIYYTY